jgi:hypothetical protein
VRRPVDALGARKAAQAGVLGAAPPPEVVPQQVGLRAVEQRPGPARQGAAQQLVAQPGARERVHPLETPHLVLVCRAVEQPVESRVVPQAG